MTSTGKLRRSVTVAEPLNKGVACVIHRLRLKEAMKEHIKAPFPIGLNVVVNLATCDGIADRSEQVPVHNQGAGCSNAPALVPCVLILTGFRDSLATSSTAGENRGMSEAAVKKYVVRLSAEERQTLAALISKGKHPAALVLKARILLKADVSEAGEGWSDSRIVKALDVSPATIYRTRQRLVEEGFEAVLARKHSPNSARPRIFDGAAEAKLIALTCSPPPRGRAKWTLRLLEDTVVELNIVERASDNTIGRTLKKRSQTASEQAVCHSA